MRPTARSSWTCCRGPFIDGRSSSWKYPPSSTFAEDAERSDRRASPVGRRRRWKDRRDDAPDRAQGSGEWAGLHRSRRRRCRDRFALRGTRMTGAMLDHSLETRGIRDRPHLLVHLQSTDGAPKSPPRFQTPRQPHPGAREALPGAGDRGPPPEKYGGCLPTPLAVLGISLRTAWNRFRHPPHLRRVEEVVDQHPRAIRRPHRSFLRRGRPTLRLPGGPTPGLHELAVL